jgi:hypothetical protein
MRRAPLLAGVTLLAIPVWAVSAQVQRWNDRSVDQRNYDSPTVRVAIDGPRSLGFNAPVRVRVRVSDDAYLVVGRVSAAGRLTILFPVRSTGRTFVRGGADMIVRGRQSGSFASFYANEYGGGTGYVFAIASYAPLDLSRFRSSDFDAAGGSLSPFAMASRNVAYRPEALLARFASWVLYDDTVPFDYDIDFYSIGTATYASRASHCLPGAHLFYGYDGWSAYSGGLGFYPGLAHYQSYCNSFFNSYFWCLGYSTYSHLGLCSPSYQPFIVRGPPRAPPATPQFPVDSAPSTINRGVVNGGLWKPDTVSRIGDGDPRLTKPNDDASSRLGLPRPTDAVARPRDITTRPDDDGERLYTIPQRSLDEIRRRTLDEMRRRDGVTMPGGRVRNEGEAPPSRGRYPNADGAPERSGAWRGGENETDPRRTRGSAGSPPSGEQPSRDTGPARDRGAAPSREVRPTREPVRESAPPRESPRRYETPAREAPPRTRPSPPPAVRESPPRAPAREPPAARPPAEERRPPADTRKPPR